MNEDEEIEGNIRSISVQIFSPPPNFRYLQKLVELVLRAPASSAATTATTTTTATTQAAKIT